MTPSRVLVAAVTTAVSAAAAGVLAVAAPAQAGQLPPPPGTRAVAVWNAATDTTPQLFGGETSPRGSFTYDQPEDAANLNDVSVSGKVTGLTPGAFYVTVLYVDGLCLPTPSVTAFPSAPFQTDSTGRAVLRHLNLNPQAIDALRTFDVDQTRSASIREVLMPGQTYNGLPVTVPTLPNPGETEACNRAPQVN